MGSVGGCSYLWPELATGGFPIRPSMCPVGVCVCVCERVWGSFMGNSMQIIVCAPDGTYGCSWRGFLRHALQSKVIKINIHTHTFCVWLGFVTVYHSSVADINLELKFLTFYCSMSKRGVAPSPEIQFLATPVATFPRKQLKSCFVLWFCVWFILLLSSKSETSYYQIILPCFWLLSKDDSIMVEPSRQNSC